MHFSNIRPDIEDLLAEAAQKRKIRTSEDADEGLMGDDSQSSM